MIHSCYSKRDSQALLKNNLKTSLKNHPQALLKKIMTLFDQKIAVTNNNLCFMASCRLLLLQEFKLSQYQGT